MTFSVQNVGCFGSSRALPSPQSPSGAVRAPRTHRSPVHFAGIGSRVDRVGPSPMLAPPAALSTIFLRRRNGLSIVTPNSTARGRRKRFVVVVVVSTLAAAALLDGRLFASLLGRLQTGVKGFVGIPCFASVGSVVVADRLATGLSAFSRGRAVQVVNLGQIVVGHVEGILGCRRPGQRRCALLRLRCLVHFRRRPRLLLAPVAALAHRRRSAGRRRMADVEHLATALGRRRTPDGSAATMLAIAAVLVSVQKR